MFNQAFLKKLKILYVEDDHDISEKFQMVLAGLFKESVLARDGQEGLDKFHQSLEEESPFDVIISDINMPVLNGIEFLKEVRKVDRYIPFIFTTAFSDSKYTIDAIRLGVSHYAIKPINTKDLLLHIQEICEIKYQQKIIEQTKVELQQYVDVVDQVAIISKTDPKGVITFANEIFCEISKYSRDELIGQNQNIVRHPDMLATTFEHMWSEIKDGKTWRGKIKNKDKNGEAYYVNATIFPVYDDMGESIIEYVGIRFLTTEDEIEKKEFKKKVVANFRESKRRDMVARTKIDQLKKELTILQNQVKTEDIDLLKTSFNQEKQKNKKYTAQINAYELELSELTTKYNNLVSDSNRSVQKAVERQKAAQQSAVKLRRAYDLLEEDLKNKEKELQISIEQVKSQSKVIKDLKDVLEHRESQLEKSEQGKNR